MTDQQDITQEELLPCPFCGGKAKDNRDLQNWGDIFCTKCGCHMLTGDIGSATSQWNTRAANEENKRLHSFLELVTSKRTTMSSGAEMTYNNNPTLGELIDMAQELLGGK